MVQSRRNRGRNRYKQIKEATVQADEEQQTEVTDPRRSERVRRPQARIAAQQGNHVQLRPKGEKKDQGTCSKEGA